MIKMELLEKTSMPRFDRKIADAKYRRSEKGKIVQKRYNHSDKGRATRRVMQRRYGSSEKGRATHRRYWQSEKGRVMGRAQSQRYRNTPWGYAVLREWVERNTLSGKLAEYERERYHRIQDEAGCHSKIGTFYPAYRFLKALENAEIVEVKRWNSDT